MKSKSLRNKFVLGCLLFLLTGAGMVLASNNGYANPWFTVDGGGGRSANGPFSLSGTIGQTDAGPMTGGAFGLQGGYWSVMLNSNQVPELPFQVYLPLVIR